MSGSTSDAGEDLAFREAPTTFNNKGEAVIDWSLTPKRLDRPVHIIAPPRYTVPIIFVPGIMGSNLSVINDVDGLHAGDPVWLYNGNAGMAYDWALRSARTRQLRLQPQNTQVYPWGEVPERVDGIGDPRAIQTQRFWGEVGAASYIEFLVWLEGALNGGQSISQQKQFQDNDFAQAWSAMKQPFQKLTKRELSHVADIRFPVYACGYNWLQSNNESAKTLQKRINDVIKVNNNKSFNCEKVILVTHSMGGLVARACSELLGMRDKIAGIVHGVMPATGAAVAYKRVRAGTEGMAGDVIGPDAETVSAVFANSPGALQLLPNRLYPSGWLKVGVGTGANFTELFKLPKEDPYEDIYAQRGTWWALMREELINPAHLSEHRGWDSYIDNLTKAKDFHAALGDKYHSTTFALYGTGNSDAERTWQSVRWGCTRANAVSHLYSPRIAVRLDERTARETAKLHTDNGKGELSVQAGTMHFHFNISGKDTDGDGTVPACSGKGPYSDGKQVYAMRGFGHEAAYRNGLVQQAALHSILSIASQIRVC